MPRPALATNSPLKKVRWPAKIKAGSCFTAPTVATSLILLFSSDQKRKLTNTGNGEHKKRGAPAFTGAPLFVWGWREIYGFGCACGCVLALCFLLWMFFDAPFCSLLICFFLEAVSVPPLALRSAATCLLMPFC